MSTQLMIELLQGWLHAQGHLGLHNMGMTAARVGTAGRDDSQAAALWKSVEMLFWSGWVVLATSNEGQVQWGNQPFVEDHGCS